MQPARWPGCRCYARATTSPPPTSSSPRSITTSAPTVRGCGLHHQLGDQVVGVAPGGVHLLVPHRGESGRQRAEEGLADQAVVADLHPVGDVARRQLLEPGGEHVEV